MFRILRIASATPLQLPVAALSAILEIELSWGSTISDEEDAANNVFAQRILRICMTVSVVEELYNCDHEHR